MFTSVEELPEVPSAFTNFGITLERESFDSRLLPESDLPLVMKPASGIAILYKKICGLAVPPFMCERQLAKMQQTWEARSTDVFLVDPGMAVPASLMVVLKALAEQRPVQAVNPEFPRFLDAAVSRRGWGYVEAMDSIDVWQRRCFTTHCPPSLFPCCNAGLPGRDAPPGSAPGPKIAVLVADPRVTMWAIYLKCQKMNQLRGDLGPACFLKAGFGLGGDIPGFSKPIECLIEWARAEAMAPDRVKLFCVEDFFREPRVAMEGLVKFLDVQLRSEVTQQCLQMSTEIFDVGGPRVAAHALPTIPAWTAASDIANFEDYKHTVVLFERALEVAQAAINTVWQATIASLFRTPSLQLAAYARSAHDHVLWRAPSWWAKHNVGLCRPCLHFPRGTCTREDCGHCHGPGHPKPKRTPRHRRRNRRSYFNRTPSPGLSPAFQ